MALPMCSYEGCREYVDRIDGWCGVHQPPPFDGTAQSAERINLHWNTVEANEKARAARIARVDETARAIFAAQFTATGSDSAIRMFYPTPVFDDALAADCAAAYRFALALERARDEAIKEVQ